MKLSTLLIALVFFNLLLAKFASGAVPSDEIIQGAIMTAMGGNFSDGALGSRFYDIRRMISENAVKADQILINDISNDKDFGLNISRRYVTPVIELTYRNDPKGAAQAAAFYRKLLDEGLSDYDQSSDKDRYLKQLSEIDSGRIQRLLQYRISIDKIINNIENNAGERPTQR